VSRERSRYKFPWHIITPPYPSIITSLFSIYCSSKQNSIPLISPGRTAAMDHPSKRIFICCDGTRNDCIRDQNDMITNVARFARCLKPYGDDGKLQLIYYHEGIGTLDGEKQKWDSVTGQSTMTTTSIYISRTTDHKVSSRYPWRHTGCVPLPLSQLPTRRRDTSRWILPRCLCGPQPCLFYR
jgi:hypothetical protein